MTFYSIDTNALIDLLRRWYAPRIFPSVIANCEGLVRAGRLRSPDEVLVELERKSGDVVHEWAMSQDDLFVPTDENIQTAAGSILDDYPMLDPDSTETVADPYVIALAQLREGVVVTTEGRSNDPAHPKIPDVCSGLGIGCVNLLGFFEAESWQF